MKKQFLSTRLFSLLFCTLLMAHSASALTDALKVRISGNNYSDETVIRFLNGATPGFDGNYDAWKLFSSNQQVPSIYTQIDSASQLSINAYPQLDRQYAIDLHLIIHAATSYTFKPITLGAFPGSVCIVMQDLQTGNYYNMKDTNSYSFQLPLMNMSSPVRFRMIFTVPVSTVTTPASCFSNADGTAIVTKAGNYNWSYFVQDSNGNTVISRSNINETDTVPGLAGGDYRVVEVNPYGCGSIDSFVVNAPAQVISAFHVQDTTVNLSNAQVSFSNASQNATAYSWDFGDGSPSSTQANPVHTFTAAGDYTVTLFVANGNCDDASQQVIHVVQDPMTAVNNAASAGLSMNVMQQDGNIVVETFLAQAAQPLQVSLYDITGRRLDVQEHPGNSRFTFVPDVSGIYIITASSGSSVLTHKISFTK